MCTSHQAASLRSFKFHSSSKVAAANSPLNQIAISIEQLDANLHGHIIRQLPHPPGELFHDYFDRVNRLVINHNGHSTSRAGIEVIMKSSKILMNLGLLKMTWILHHRAISHAQLLGLHRPYRISSDETVSQMNSRQDTWFSLCQKDLYISLLLGLPYASDGSTISANVYGRPGTLGCLFYRLIRLSARVIDRNQMGCGTSISDTHDIEKHIDAAADELSGELWNAPAALGQGRINRETYTECLGSQLWFFQLKVLLHQPLMIQSIEDHSLIYHRDACFSACRDTLRIYHLMRSDSLSAFGMVKLIDYQAFICSAILLLGLLGYGTSNPTPLSQTVDQYHDADTVQSTLDILRKASKESSNSTASQAVRGLETLAKIVNTGKSGVCTSDSDNPRTCFIKITIPGSGVISIAPGELMKNSMSKSLENNIGVLPPVFHLSHVSSQDYSNQGFSRAVKNSIIPETNVIIPAMDFDWTKMIDLEAGNDWAWLADVENGVM